MLQILLGRPLSPALLPSNLADPRSSWIDVLRGTIGSASAETRSSLRTRASLHGFQTAIRVGASCVNPDRTRLLVLNLVNALRVAEAAGVRLHFSGEPAHLLNEVRRPWRWPTRLSAKELVGLTGWPLGDGALPGIRGEHPKLLAPPEGLPDSRRAFAISSAPGTSTKLGATAQDSLQHTVLTGPTGSGKSNAMLNLICADIEAGRGVLVIDPKSDLTRDVLSQVPESRKADVVVIDPVDNHPVGLNPLARAHRNPELVADSVLAAFKELFADSWGPRTQDILLITLAHQPGASLVWLPALLSDPVFRKKMTRGLTDRIGLGTF